MTGLHRHFQTFKDMNWRRAESSPACDFLEKSCLFGLRLMCLFSHIHFLQNVLCCAVPCAIKWLSLPITAGLHIQKPNHNSGISTPQPNHSVSNFLHLPTHSSACTNGFAISSLPSTGLTSTNRVPRATTKPRDRVEVFPSSSCRTSSTSSRTRFIRAS